MAQTNGLIEKIVSKNNRAYFDYTIHDTYEAGVSLVGWEVKSLRIYGISLKNSFCIIRNGEAFWLQAHLKNPLPHISSDDRIKKLLLKKTQIKKINGKLSEKNKTIIPLECYFKNNRYFKILLGICSKNTKYDKREKIKKREMNKNFRHDE